ncbi:MAG: DEAD/DEAH box helicase, partial [Firmicutes bacterium]|nr:DEAD/DEAH box helicase [Bacillota bacterium]
MKINYTGISDSRSAYIAAKLIEKTPGQGLIICATASRAARIAGDLSFFSRVRTLVLPDQDAAGLRYEAKSTGELSGRLRVLSALNSGEPCVVVAPVLGALKKLPPPEVYTSRVVRLELGRSYVRGALISSLSSMGYEREAAAEAEGQFAVRGDIIDIYCPGSEYPVRAEFFDEELDSLRTYDPLTQRSVENISDFTVWPAQIITDDEDAFARGLKGILSAYSAAMKGPIDEDSLEKLRAQRDKLVDCIETGVNRQYLEAYISYFYDNPSMIWDHMTAPSFVLLDDPTRLTEALDFYESEENENRKVLLSSRLAVPKDFESAPDPGDLRKLASGSFPADIVFTTPFAQQIRFADRLDEIRNVRAVQAPVFGGHMEMLGTELKRYLKNGYRVVIASSGGERADNIKEFLSRAGIESGVEVRVGQLSLGMDLQDEKLLFLSEGEIFPNVKRSRRSSRSQKDRAIKAFTDVNKGDYVVHENHGIGRFDGVEKLEIDGSVRDYLKILYAGADVLYVPVDQLETIQKYVGSEGVAPKINRLSGSDWQMTKERAKAAIRDMAEDLLKLQAQRNAHKGWQFGPDSPWQKEFEDAFPYVETQDQLRCAEEIKRDMESPKAMDRLLCGDVGYGKTEVAARAVFKCLDEGKQAAILVPTTVLANQHFHSFKERFRDYPFNIEMLSRFRTESQQAEIVRKLAKGDVDLVIGTHRLLSKDIRFKDLGLLVVDEEQRFGVEHKERIKQLKTDVDVLTLSATPIPRTLHMSLIGVRDMSVIEEPPEDRYPVQTYVMEQDDRMLTDVIRRELGRGGQVYLVYNRVRGIQTLARHVHELVPEATISVGHGQMGERELEDVMMEFTEGRSQILISTTIIESGIDI